MQELRAECAGLYTNGGSRPLTAVAKSVQKYLEVALLAQFGDRQRTIRELKVGETLRKRDSRWAVVDSRRAWFLQLLLIPRRVTA